MGRAQPSAQFRERILQASYRRRSESPDVFFEGEITRSPRHGNHSLLHGIKVVGRCRARTFRAVAGQERTPHHSEQGENEKSAEIGGAAGA